MKLLTDFEITATFSVAKVVATCHRGDEGSL